MANSDTNLDPLVGRELGGKFKILERIARGGMGAVYRAEQASLGRACAIKVLRLPEGGDVVEFSKRFFLEASVVSKLTHPNTVTVFDYGKSAEDGMLYLAMELLEGRTLLRAIRDDGPLPRERALSITRQIARSLREAHGLGVVHRDVKPANVYLVKHGDEDDFVKVIDFGLVKEADEDLTQAGTFMGSPKYMAPEQIRGDATDGRADVYALGVVLFEMLTGKVPFDKGGNVQTLMAHVNDPPPRLAEVNPLADVDELTEALVARCLAKNPDERFLSMEELLAALKATSPNALTMTMTGTDGTTAGSGAHVFVSRGMDSDPASRASLLAAESAAPPKKGKGLLIGAGLAAVAAAAAVALYSQKTPPPAPPPAPAAAQSAEPPKPEPAASVAPPPKPEPPKEATLRIVSEPSGASVRLDGADGDEVCTGTPCSLTVKGERAKAGAEVKLYLTKAGFHPQTATLKIGATPEKVKLKARAAAAPPPPTLAPGWKDPVYLPRALASAAARGMGAGDGVRPSEATALEVPGVPAADAADAARERDDGGARGAP